MNKIGVWKLFDNVIWIITALGSIHLGLISIGYSIFSRPIFMTTLSGLIIPIHYIIGLAGLISLLMFFWSCSAYGEKCGMCRKGK